MTSIAVRKKEATPKVTAEATPSEQLIKKADATVVVTLGDGRNVTLKKPGVLSQFRLIRMLGDAAKNQVYVSMVLPFTYITAIDGKLVNAPNTEREIEALITRLGDEGVDVVMHGVADNFGAQSPEAVQEEVKN